MKLLVVYLSFSGSTKRLAEGIFAALPEEKEIQPMSEVSSLEGYDLVFLGFPVMQFGPPAEAVQFISGKAAGKRLALFVTHAVDPASKDPFQQALLAKELAKCRAACKAADLAGFFHCRGELSEKAAEELISSGIPMLAQFASLRPLTLGHPDPHEMDEAAGFARSLV